MKVTCPECQSQFPISAGFADADSKRLAMTLANADPPLGRAVISYLSLHKPAKTVLRVSRAARIADEVVALATAAEIRRSGVSRPNSSGFWVAAIEQMMELRDKLRLPLSGHGYLTEVAFAFSDKADAAAERQREASARAGKHLAAGSEKGASTPAETPLARQLAWIEQMERIGHFEADQAEEERASARARYGGGSG